MHEQEVRATDEPLVRIEETEDRVKIWQRGVLTWNVLQGYPGRVLNKVFEGDTLLFILYNDSELLVDFLRQLRMEKKL